MLKIQLLTDFSVRASKKVMFSPPPCLIACVFVCQQYYTKTTEKCFIKYGGILGHGPRNTFILVQICRKEWLQALLYD